MPEINLLKKYPVSYRPIEDRGRRKLSNMGKMYSRPTTLKTEEIIFEQQLLSIARKFGQEYFDGDRLYGYGGYSYHPRFWSDTVKNFADHYNLDKKARILDVGCAKGFMMYDFKKYMPQIHIEGVDISSFAKEKSIEEMKPYIINTSAESLPFEDNSFDLVVSINTVDHLNLAGCKAALSEIQRVTKKDSFISVNSWRTEKEKEMLLKWNITALTCMQTKEWESVFDEVGYLGDYWWFIP
jgi:SAM-dependent methyltransferase